MQTKASVMKSIWKFLPYFILLEASLFWGVYFNLEGAIILMLLIISIVLAASQSKIYFFIFTIFLVTNDIFLSDKSLFGIIGIKQIMGFSMVLYYYVNTKSIKKNLNSYNNKFNFKIIDGLAHIVIVLLVYWTYRNFKDGYFNLHGSNINVAFFKTVNVYLYLISLYYFIKIVFSMSEISDILASVLYSVLNMLIFSFISPYLPMLGFKSIGTEGTEFDTAEFQRYAGIVPDGDSNTLGAYFVLTISFFLLHQSYFQKYLVMCIVLLSMVIIALTGSRSAFITLMFCYLIYFTLYPSFKMKFYLFIVLFVVLVLAAPYFTMLFQRLALAGEQLDTGSESNRIGKWILYWDFFLKNPSIFIFGTVKELRIGWGDVFYQAHNVYVTMTYFCGLSIPLFFLRAQLRILLLASRINKLRLYFMLFVPFMSLCFFVSDLGIFYCFICYSVLFFKINTIQKKQ